MTREERIESKRQALQDVVDQQLVLAKKMVRIANYPKTTRSTILMNRCMKLVGLMIQVKSLEVHKQLILWQPIEPVEGLAIVGGGPVGSNPEDVGKSVAALGLNTTPFIKKIK